MADSGFVNWLERSLVLLRRDAMLAPIALALGEHLLLLDVDGDRALLTSAGEDLNLSRNGGEADVLLVTTRPTIVAILANRTTLLDAVLDGTLTLVGRPSALIAFDAALRAYLDAVVRAQSMPELWAAYLDVPRRIP